MRRTFNGQASKAATGADANLGLLPEWDLTHLYPATDAPAVQHDLDSAEQQAHAFEAAYKGQLEALAQGINAGKSLAEAVIRYEKLEDLLGRLASFAGLVYATDTSDQARAKFYGDIQEKITARMKATASPGRAIGSAT